MSGMVTHEEALSGDMSPRPEQPPAKPWAPNSMPTTEQFLEWLGIEPLAWQAEVIGHLLKDSATATHCGLYHGRNRSTW